jgi:hypothetical protein
MSEANKRARIEYLQSLYRSSEDKALRYRTALEIISKYSNEPRSAKAAQVALEWPALSDTSQLRQQGE